jgi:uncharacterized membrane protein (Fun14 family)
MTKEKIGYAIKYVLWIIVILILLTVLAHLAYFTFMALSYVVELSWEALKA